MREYVHSYVFSQVHVDMYVDAHMFNVNTHMTLRMLEKPLKGEWE